MDAQSAIGRTETHRDIADPARIARLAATLDHETPPWRPGILPPLGHWLCFQPDARQSSIGPDGHQVRTDAGLLPNVDLPRRMWAGSRIRFLRDISLGAPIMRTSTLTGAVEKNGRSGRMLFVTVRHQIAQQDGEPAIIDDQDIVYREAAVPGAPVQRAVIDAGDMESVSRVVVADPVMLFRYSALTFNGHRIHYDRAYCREEEGYPGLVVHGPLVATLLLDHLLRHDPQARVAGFSFRAMSPVFDGEAITLDLVRTATEARLRAIGPAGVAMTAIAELAP